MTNHGTVAVLQVLKVLKQHSDEKHPLLQSEILSLLQQDHQVFITRKTLRAHLESLVASGYPIYYQKGWYYEHEFCDSEIHLLIHSLLFNRYIPNGQTKQLIQKLSALGSAYASNPHTTKEKPLANAQFFYTLESVSEAIDLQKQIVFQYCLYNIHKELEPICDEAHQPKRYTVNPYEIAVVHGRHYLIGNVDKYDNLSHFRLDRIKSIEILDQPQKAKEQVHGSIELAHMTRYVEKRPYMFSGEATKHILRIKHYMIGDVMDYFGKEVSFAKEDDTWVVATLFAEKRSLVFWMRQYGDDVELK